MTFAIFFIGIQLVNAQNFTAKVSKTTLGENQRFRIQFTIDKQGTDNFRPPVFTNFKIVSGPMQSTSFQYINGKKSFEKSFSYTLEPKAKGVFTIGSATTTYQGKTIHSNKVKITVVKGKPKTKEQLENDPEVIAKENIFLVAEISNTNPYIGESINVVYKLFMDTNNAAVNNEQESKSPTYSGFWKQNIKVNITEQRGKYKGKEMSYYILRKDVLIPQQVGRLKLNPLEIEVAAVVAAGKSRRDFFGRIVRGQKRVNLKLSTGTRIVNVKPLPTIGKPTNFDGAVGEFSFRVKSNKDLLKANETAQVSVQIKGKGNLKLISLPKIETPKGLEQYEPEHKDAIRINLSGQSGYIKDTYTIVPQYRGKYKIPMLSFSYFNPKTAKYQTINSKDIIINVPEGELPVEEKQVNPKLNNNVITDNDIRSIHTKTNLEAIAKKEDFFKSNLFYLLLLLPMLSIPIGIFLGNKKQKRDADIVGNKRRKANRLAKKYLSSAKKELGNKEPFYIALEKALHNYLKAKLQIETSEISKEKISEILADKEVDEQTITKFIKVLNDCDFARYTPTSNLQMEKEYNNAADIIMELDKML